MSHLYLWLQHILHLHDNYKVQSIRVSAKCNIWYVQHLNDKLNGKSIFYNMVFIYRRIRTFCNQNYTTGHPWWRQTLTFQKYNFEIPHAIKFCNHHNIHVPIFQDKSTYIETLKYIFTHAIYSQSLTADQGDTIPCLCRAFMSWQHVQLSHWHS